MRRTTVQPGDQLIDSRDVIKRIEELEENLEMMKDDCETDGSAVIDHPDFDSDEAEELSSLKDLASQGEGYGDWDHGETLILDEYFTEHIQQLIEDTEDVPEKFEKYIDFEKMAEDYKVDYHEVSFGGYNYYMRA